MPRHLRTPTPGRQHPVPPPDAWADKLSLRKVGAEYHGPCPLCGGTDRFHVRAKADGTGLFHCRHCGDAPDFFPDVMRDVWGWFAKDPAPRSRPTPRSRPDTPPRAPVTSATSASDWWAKAMPADRTPAHNYLTRTRTVWPPRDVPLPRDVRWLPRAHFPAWQPDMVPPPGATGCILFGYRDAGGSLIGVSAEALTMHGDLLTPRWRRTFGRKAGGTFTAHVGTNTHRLVVCEGEVTALACRWFYDDATVRATGGTAGLTLAACHGFLRPDAHVTIDTDGDDPGRLCATDLLFALRRRGVTHAHRRRRDRHRDAADDLRSEVTTMAAQHGGPDNVLLMIADAL